MSVLTRLSLWPRYRHGIFATCCRLFGQKKACKRGGHGHPRTPLATPLCSSPLLEKHSKNHYAVLNSRGENKENYCPGSKWCYACKRKFYKEAGTTEVNKRRKVNLISALPFINNLCCYFHKLSYTLLSSCFDDIFLVNSKDRKMIQEPI